MKPWVEFVGTLEDSRSWSVKVALELQAVFR